MINELQQYDSMLDTWFFGKTILAEELRTVIKDFSNLPFMPAIDDDSLEMIARNFEARHSITMNRGSALNSPAYQPWLQAKKAEINPYFWERYQKLLIQKSLPHDVVQKIDQVTDRIVGFLQDPSIEGSWSRIGLVMGQVQSGKTANYIGVIGKAADAGYKLIIVLAGLNNKLRNQTQIRIEEGFVGRDSSKVAAASTNSKYVGVGLIDSQRIPGYLTTSLRDFNKIQANGSGIPLQNMNEPVVLVIKKNSSVLANLLEWLKDHNLKNASSEKISEPLLIIDDEADNASINIKYGQDGVTKINAQIRYLLSISERSCYIGYTATPFANIFIDPVTEDSMYGEDLFPRDFIVSLDPPSNHIGPEYLFLGEGADSLIEIDEFQEILPLKHKKDLVMIGLPESLKEAIRYFVLAKATRLVRGHTSKHTSMLVNASVYNDVQGRIRDGVQSYLNQIQASVRINGALPFDQAMQDEALLALYDTWKLLSDVDDVEWSEIQKQLLRAAAPIQVALINSRSRDNLDYGEYEKDGLHVIAVGGYTLSRGLTLEGLMVTYFFRRSLMSDTLLQMGRWFGYRDGYVDLCRIWMPKESIGYYEHIAENILMIREELREMEERNATPMEFGLRIRTHPDSLMITARNKMGSSKNVTVSIGLHLSFIETYVIHKSEAILEKNRSAARSLVERMRNSGLAPEDPPQGSGSSGYLYRNVGSNDVLDFLGIFQNHPGSFKTETDPVRKYIRDRSETELADWDLFFPSVGISGAVIDQSLGISINCQRRSTEIESINGSDVALNFSKKNNRVSTRGIEKIGLNINEIKQSEEDFLEKRQSEGEPPLKNYPDHIYRKIRSNPLLVVHMIDPRNEDGSTIVQPVVAWSISFPDSSNREQTTEYNVNTTWLQEQMLGDPDEEEMDGDGDQ